jgi:hypothetical protein
LEMLFEALMWGAGGVVAVAGGGGWLSVSVMPGVAVRSKNFLGPVVVGGVDGRVVGIDVVGWVIECALGCVVMPAAVVRLGVATRGWRWWWARILKPGGVVGGGRPAGAGWGGFSGWGGVCGRASACRCERGWWGGFGGVGRRR